MGSKIKINKIDINISPCIDKTEANQCEHFTMRGYVSEMREKDWKQCCPFPVNESAEQSTLPPLEVPKFRRWDCENCRRKGIDMKDQVNCNGGNNAVANSEIREASISHNVLDRREIDLNQPIDLNLDSECLQSNGKDSIEDLNIPSTTYTEQNSGSNKKVMEPVDDTTMKVTKTLTNNRYEGSPSDVQPRADTLHEQNKERDFDLNCPGIIDLDADEDVDSNIGHETLTRTNAIEDHQNRRGYVGFTSNERMLAMNPLNLGVQFPKRTFYPGECSANMDIIGSSRTHGSYFDIIGSSRTHGIPMGQSFGHYNKSYLSNNSHYYFHGPPFYGASSSTQHVVNNKGPSDFRNPNLIMAGRRGNLNTSNSFMQNLVSRQFNWQQHVRRTSQHQNLGFGETLEPIRFSESYNCRENRNPADFTVPEPENPYMIDGEDLKFERRVPEKRPGFPTPSGSNKKRNL